MKSLSLGAALTSAAANASVKGEDTDVSFQRGVQVEAVIQPSDGAFVGTAKVQGSNSLDSVADASAVWVDLLTFTAPAANSGSKSGVVTAYRRMRLNCTAFTSGSVEGYLVS